MSKKLDKQKHKIHISVENFGPIEKAEIDLCPLTVFVGDGAGWIWNLCDEYFPNAVEIIDYMHAKSHLYDAAKYAFGEE